MHISQIIDGSRFMRIFLPYRMLRCIRKEMKTGEARYTGFIAESDFTFNFLSCDSPAMTREELRELERKNYIRYEDEGFLPTHRGYYFEWYTLLALLKYTGRSVLTPVAVTLLTIYLTGKV